ncbi:hypothetical protein RV05_GL002183 [Enterococcus hirae]|nr:hypothetical protein RV05_GL002183 [Enterococcus hirae]
MSFSSYAINWMSSKGDTSVAAIGIVKFPFSSACPSAIKLFS